MFTGFWKSRAMVDDSSGIRRSILVLKSNIYIWSWKAKTIVAEGSAFIARVFVSSKKSPPCIEFQSVRNQIIVTCQVIKSSRYFWSITLWILIFKLRYKQKHRQGCEYRSRTHLTRKAWDFLEEQSIWKRGWETNAHCQDINKSLTSISERRAYSQQELWRNLVIYGSHDKACHLLKSWLNIAAIQHEGPTPLVSLRF